MRAPKSLPSQPVSQRVSTPGAIHFSRFIWSAVVVALLAFGAAFVLNGFERSGGVPNYPSMALGVVLAALGALCGIFLILLMRGRRSGREMLTTLAIVAAIPMLIRGVPGLSWVAGAMILAAAALWTPRSRKYFQPRPPRKQR